MSFCRVLPVLAALLGPSGAALAAATAEPAPIPVTIEDHRFAPAEIRVPAGQSMVLDIRNADATAEEFESTALKVEKVIPGGRSGKVRLRALTPGRYPFMGEYHPDTAQGVVVVE